jgi:catechol-2,3-dioxygenase
MYALHGLHACGSRHYRRVEEARDEKRPAAEIAPPSLRAEEQTMIPVTKIGYACLESPDPERLLDHYLHVVGLGVTARDKGSIVLSTQCGEETVILEQGSAPRCRKLALQIDARADLGETLRALRERGLAATRRSDPTPCVADAVEFVDPNGATVELFISKTLTTAARPGGVAPLKLGHVAFVSDDVRGLVDFYTQTLGFRVSDWMGDYFAFLRCSPDHHTVNFVQGEVGRMHHIAFELQDWAHIQTACELFGQKEVKIIWGPGRHGIGHNVFLYHRDPDDHIVEFYIEMDRMSDESSGAYDPRPWHKDRPQRPKVWDRIPAGLTWGMPPGPDFLRTHFKNAAFD